MKISIITVCYNSEQFIRSAIDSVLGQTHKDIEYIIVDGASKDKTIEIIKSYGSRISKFVTEPDKGIYDAMNKGLQMVSGDYVAILNSDDFYIHNKVIEHVVSALEREKTDCLFGDLIYVDQQDINKQVRYWKPGAFKENSFRKGWHPAHPSFILKREMYLRYGTFNLRFKLAADFELMLRLLEKYRITSFYLPEPLVKMRLGGASNKNISNILSQNKECIEAFKINHLQVSWWYPLQRLLPKLKQFWR